MYQRLYHLGCSTADTREQPTQNGLKNRAFIMYCNKNSRAGAGLGLVNPIAQPYIRRLKLSYFCPLSAPSVLLWLMPRMVPRWLSHSSYTGMTLAYKEELVFSVNLLLRERSSTDSFSRLPHISLTRLAPDNSGKLQTI